MSNTPERTLVGSIQKFSVEDGPGIRTTVFLKGCPLKCRWCHNPEMIETFQQLIQSPNNCIGCGHCIEICPHSALSIHSERGIQVDREKCDVCLKCADECYANALRPVAKYMTVDEVMETVLQDKGFYDNTGGGITISGGEVLMHSDFAEALIDKAAEAGINVCLDTSGMGDSEAFMRLSLKENVTDILYDMKSVDDNVHMVYTGVSNKKIIENLKMLANDSRSAEKITMRMPLIKGVNDTQEIIEKTGALYRELGIRRVNLLPYHNLGISKKRNVGGIQEEFEPPDETRLTEIENYFSDEINLEVCILGRV